MGCHYAIEKRKTPQLVFAGTALMQTGKAIEILTMIMFTYLTLSIAISILMNWYNKRMAIKER